MPTDILCISCFACCLCLAYWRRSNYSISLCQHVKKGEGVDFAGVYGHTVLCWNHIKFSMAIQVQLFCIPIEKLSMPVGYPKSDAADPL